MNNPSFKYLQLCLKQKTYGKTGPSDKREPEMEQECQYLYLTKSLFSSTVDETNFQNEGLAAKFFCCFSGHPKSSPSFF